MIQSMTGFGAAERGGFKVEIRSLNHRFLEISIKLPHSLGRHEIPLREFIKKRFGRGKFDVYVQADAGGRTKIALDATAARELKDALEGLKDSLSLKGDVGLDALLPFRELFMSEEVSFDDAETEKSLYGAFEEALGGVERMRAAEGGTLAEELASRMGLIESMAAEVSSLAPAVAEAQRAKFLERLKAFLPGADDARLIQEAAACAERADITEELTRLASHVGQFTASLAGGGTVGRRLDFLLQEFFREANTIGSKTDDSRVSGIVIDMKAEIEKAREQVQNIQ